MPDQKKRQGNAHYTVHVPTHDPYGNRLIDLSAVGMQSLQAKIPRLLHSLHSEGPHETHPYRHMKILAIDNPQVDTAVKSMAVELAQMAGHPHIFMHKDGPQGPEPWTLANRAHDGRPSQYADPNPVI